MADLYEHRVGREAPDVSRSALLQFARACRSIAEDEAVPMDWSLREFLKAGPRQYDEQPKEPSGGEQT